MADTPAVHPVRKPYRNVCLYLALLIPVALLAFWKTYSSGVTFSGRSATPVVHLHAALMTLWVLMLIGQAWLIRTKRFRVHRWVGRSSFLIAPIIIWSAAVAVRGTIGRDAEGIVQDASLQIFGLGQVLVFAVTWGLAILYRKRTSLHVRFMVSTAFAMGSAIGFRLARNWLGWVPGLDSIGGLAIGNLVLLTLPLLVLIAVDWRMGMKRSPYWVVTILIALMHLGFPTIARTDAWLAFCQWYADLPSWLLFESPIS
jgi:hypothetical protein